LLSLIGVGLAPSWAAEPVYIAFDGAYGVKTNTAPKAIERGIQAAMEEINARGGVLGGRQLKLLTTDNQGLPARARDNYMDLAAKPGVVAVLAGKFSPVIEETVPEGQRMKVPLISVWGSADPITDGAGSPSFAFRLSLKDSWGVEAMMLRAKSVHRATRQCAILPNTAWGRSADAVLTAKARGHGISVVATHWYNWGDVLFQDALAACATASAQAIVMVANEREAASLISQLADLPQTARLPVVAHW
jgi:branched-chain amino acid transport system substrate-binding protein